MKLSSYTLLLFLCASVSVSNVNGQCTCYPNSCSITATISYQNSAAQGDYSIFLASGHSQISNPFIIVEGLDFFNSFGCAQFLSSAGTMIQYLNSAGYDVVFLNFADNTDFIQRNAFLVVELINEINQNKVGNNKLVVAGLNTGAVVARYALSYMEHNQLDHETKCYISWDGPQAGLNIPIGLQIWINALNNDPFISLANFSSPVPQLNQPMLLQLLLCSAGATTSSPSGTPSPDQAHIDFLNDIRGLTSCYGYPEKCKKIGVSLGSISGATQLQTDNVHDAVSGMFFFSYSYIPPDNLPVNPQILGAVSGFVCSIADATTAAALPSGDHPATCMHNDFIFSFLYGPQCQPASLNAYDVGPGSYMSDLIDLSFYNVENYLEYGNFSEFFDQATFVPSISAFDINTNDFYFNFNEHLPIETVSPFDKCYSTNFNDAWYDFSGSANVIDLSQLAEDISSSDNYAECTSQDATVPPSDITSGNSDVWHVADNLIIGDYTVEPSAKAVLTAGSEILMEPGLDLKAGSNVVLSIIPCTQNICNPPSLTSLPPHKSMKTVSSLPLFQSDSFFIKIYPNPAGEKVFVVLPEILNNGAIVTLYNQEGVTVASSIITSSKLELNIANYPPGVYLVNYKDEQHYVTQKLSIVR
jgi:hypothetical protein